MKTFAAAEDDRIICRQCLNFAGRFADCGWCGEMKCWTAPAILRRCINFKPLRGGEDMRSAKVRWPGLFEQPTEG